ncbi:hypothetical protein DEU35_1559 [Microbacterium sp. AG157]|uniref:hypothetical protein n=1 Tax=Microbacterium TaxID=33882 RepID=UPI000E3ABC65|nr:MULTISPECIES: hypothetical protein [Microbacterium]REC98453.1 hypothetical protein DEU35_1559 [Microbacterium sp. AG157]
MAWTPAYPGARQYPEGWWNGGTSTHFTWWNNFRPMRGDVQMRLTDVTSGNWNWRQCRMRVMLRNSAGQLLGSTYIYKNYGADTNFVNIGFVSGSQSVQLGTSIGLGTNYTQALYETVDWTSEMRWNNSQAV